MRLLVTYKRLTPRLKRERRAPLPPHDRWRCLVVYLQMTLDVVSDLKVTEGIIAALRVHSDYQIAALHHSWTSATSGLRGLFLITCRREAVGGRRRRRRLAPPLRGGAIIKLLPRFEKILDTRLQAVT
ncbi:hypothetical protein EVAR_92167_1 [Eumeta japonica]|uniref:Uncharacterized protein n=1 Tax=Eumeta variegata TaxID=151549 RepID=A0A4C1SZJ4_EUMVA|nr:hypothetical protein EVAR_92167_1 [Eumeta japonica]